MNSLQYLRDQIEEKFQVLENEWNIQKYNKKSILYFDFEESNLKKILNYFKDDYGIFLTHTIETTKDILKKEKIDLIITQQTCLENSNLELILNKLQKYCPIIILTINTNMENNYLKNRIRKNMIWKVIDIEKNINKETIENYINEAFTLVKK